MSTKSNQSITINEKSENKELNKDEFYQLLSFFATGISENENFKTIKGQKLIPLHFKNWMDNDSIPNPYPLCFIKNYPEKLAISLEDFFTQLKEISPDGEKAQSEKVLNDLKLHIKSHLNGFSEEYLAKLWDKSTESLLETYNESDEKEQKAFTQRILATAKKTLNIEGEIVALSENTPLKYLNLALNKTWQETSTPFVNELDWSILQLQGFLESDHLKTHKGKAADSLKEAVGDSYEDNLDFNALSDLMENSFHEDTLPQKRRERIEKVLDCLQGFRKYYPEIKRNRTTTPLKFDQKSNSIKNIKEQLKEYQGQVLEFYKSVHIARLEVNNKYDEKKHDLFFNDFHFSFLSAEDLNSIPPFPVYLNSRDIKQSSFEQLTEFMEMNLPVKILFVVDDVIDFKNSDMHLIKTNKWSRKLASMAINVGNAYIFKTTAINVPQLEKKLLDGLNYNGPALFCIYTHRDENYKCKNCALPYHALVNSRAYPHWTFIPSSKKDLASQFNVTANPSPKNDWSDEIVADAPFTIIDYLANYDNLADHFIMLPVEHSHPDLIPFHEYQQMEDLTAKERLPYTLMTDEKGKLFKVVPDFAVIKATDNFINNWHTLQEISNVHNIKDIEQDTQIQAEEVEAETPKSKEEISREVITNILSRLVSGDLEARPEEEPVLAAPVAEEPKEQDTAEPEPAQEVQPSLPEAKEEIVEPFIETVLCTSCNECTNINSMMFAYNEDKQAEIVDASKGTFKQLVMAAEKCPAAIIHPGKPKNPDEKDLDKLIKRAEKFNI